MTKRTNVSKCKLCGQESKLVEGHVIPKFVISWLKKTSATGYIRQAVNPNLRKQDIQKVKLMCTNCERIFSTWERRFAQHLFIPFQEKKQSSFLYGDWLLSFAVSLAWRMVTVGVDNFGKSKPELSEYIDKALDCWRAFLLVHSKTPGPYEHHLLLLDYVVDTHGIDLPNGANWYFLRGVDTTIASSSKSVFVYSLLPGLVFWSCIHPPKQEGWAGTHILSDGIMKQPQGAPCSFGYFLSHRAQEVIDYLEQMSEAQRQRIGSDMLSNPEAVIASKSFEVFLIEDSMRKRQGKA